jgi:indole-3-glycerol phosphate synthase
LLVPRETELRAAAEAIPAAPQFATALRRQDVSLVAEVKRRSPSKGVINAKIDAADQAAAYAAGGAAAISVLTEPVEFGGSASDVVSVRHRVSIPVLRKDFHVHPLQLLEAKALGASAVLLIARALSPDDLRTMAREARGLGLEALVEIRDQGELERAMGVDAVVIGVNNRDLETLRIDTTTTTRLLGLIPADRIAIAESGYQTRQDVIGAAEAGADAVLIGSSVSAAGDPANAVRALCGVRRAGRGC